MITRVTVVEDDDSIRESLTLLLEGATGFRCVGAYATGEDALRDIPRKAPDVCLMDINLPGIDGTETVARLKRLLPELHVIMLTVYEDANKIFASLESGATGYLLKRTPPEALLTAITEVKNGGSPMSSQIARKVVQHFHRPPQGNDASVKLTDREEEIIQLLVKGNLYKEIAAKLNISVETVHTHLRHIYEKLQVRSRTEAVVKYLQR